jgi:hypothetical protein
MDINNVKMSSQLNGSEAVSKERKGRGSIRWKRKGSYQDLVRGSNQETASSAGEDFEGKKRALAPVL